MRRMLPRLVCTVLLTSAFAVSAPVRVFAQEQVASATLAAVHPVPSALTNSVLFPATSAGNAGVLPPVTKSRVSFDEPRRPAMLPALYVSTIALQALDVHSTVTALKNGGREANPVMQGVAHNRGALLAVKAGVAGSTIYLAEKMWKRNRTGAIVMMAIVNGIDAAIVAHNYKVVSSLR